MVGACFVLALMTEDGYCSFGICMTKVCIFLFLSIICSGYYLSTTTTKEQIFIS